MSVSIGYPSFMAYQMMKGKKGNNDGFPSIPGMIARYSALGLTNEQVAENPVWKDLTGNGHDLQMKNFAWDGMSGVGGYTENYNSNKWYKVKSRIDVTWTYKSFNARSIKDNRLAQLSYQSSLSDTGFRVLSCIIKVSGLTDGQGIEYVSYTGDCDITIEQIPEYEGYLITDGVDDEVRSAAFTLNKDWTIVGNWEFITNENKNAGLTKVYSFYLYNRDYGIFVYKYINAGQGFSVEDVKSLKAICSDGRIYLNDWQEIRNNIEQEATISKGVMAIGYFNRGFTKMAFKNLGIYNNQLLSKDECIKAYNYLQTLKAK